jgi:hypothetical protein
VVSVLNVAIGAVAQPGLWVLRIGALTLAIWGTVWHLGGHPSFPLSRAGMQTNRSLAKRGNIGMLYFGLVLGIGLATQMASPLVYVGAALALGWGMVVALPYGIGFAMGRSIPVVWALINRRVSAGQVADAFVSGRDRWRKPAALVGLAYCFSLFLLIRGG